MTHLVHGFLAACCAVVVVFSSAMPSANAQSRGSAQRQASPSSTGSPPAFLVLGHRQKVDEIQHGRDAWTLGSDGYIIAWNYEDSRWIPRAVRQVPNSSSLALEGETLWVYGPDHTTILTVDLTPIRTEESIEQPPKPSREDRVLAKETSVDGASLPCDETPSNETCAASTPIRGPDTAMISVRTLRNILVADHGSFFLFRDGWYSVSSTSNAQMEDALHIEAYSDADQRVWLDESVLASSVIDGEAHVATCAIRENRAQVRDRNLRTGAVTLVESTEDTCPLRAEYEEDLLLLAYDDHVFRWRNGETIVEQDPEDTLRAPLSSILGSSLVARASITRGCAYRRWDLSLSMAAAGSSPIARGVCARTATPIKWTYAREGEGGAGILLRTRTGSQLWLVDRTSLAVHVYQTDVDLPPHVQIQRREDGTLFIADQRTGDAMHIDAQGQVLSTEAMVWIDGRIWREADGGILVSDDGHQLLATDRGVVLDGLGVGPITSRTITSDLRRLSAQPALFSAHLRALAAGSVALRAQ